ncbi:MAG: hypothetical protein NTZ75_04855 [Euryarchaeota archaeon]|nr:hypothetical protein [Euryarchaeota archaeon]
MAKIKGILAVGVILLFLGLAFSPVTAQTTIKDQLEVSTIGDLAPVQLSEKDLTTMEKFLPALLEKMQTATSYSELIETVQSLMKEHGRQPVLVLILTLLIKTINFNFKFNQFRPVRKAAFVMSWGFTNKLLSPAISMIRPITGWFYSGRSNVVLNSRTIIIDPYPFSIKTLTGRQIGLMANFIGLYIHRSGPIADKAITFFFGYAKTIRGFDLSLECN